MRAPLKKYNGCNNEIDFETSDKKFALLAFKYLKKVAEKKSEETVQDMVQDIDDQIQEIEEDIEESKA